jgi:prephenate dehydrogenase
MFDSVTIVGVGLISGSFSLALKDRGLVRNVIGVSR